MPSSLRPTSFAKFIGQERLVAALQTMLAAAQQRKAPLDHILFFGPPGLGKTTLAQLLATTLPARLRYAQGPMLERKADVLALFGALGKNDVVFIDEIHGVPRSVAELMYAALEEGVMDVVIGVEGDTRIVRMKLPPFTLIGATTRLSRVPPPLRDRFGFVGRLNPYTFDEMKRIVENSAQQLQLTLTPGAVELVASYSRQVPRIANTLLRRVRDYQLTHQVAQIDEPLVRAAFRELGLFPHGLTDTHLVYLKALHEVFHAGWASLEALSGVLNEASETLALEIEPDLLTLGHIEKSSRGRRLTARGQQYLTDLVAPPPPRGG